jgi:uncharacterized membrane protein
MNVLLWVLQFFLAFYFLFTGVVHFVLPPGLPEQMHWMYELSPTLHYISGAAEILGGLGLILPGITRIKTWLTPLAAAGLMVVMILAAFWHLPRGESLNIGMNLVLVLLTGFVAYARWKVKPL